MRGEAGMNDNNKNGDKREYATLENVQKYVNNADRLYNDALKTSDPSKAALIELSIEELEKAFSLIDYIMTINHIDTDLINKSLNIDKILNSITDPDLIKSIDEFKINNFKNRAHGERLDSIGSLIKIAQQIYLNNKNLFTQPVNKLAQNYSKHLPKTFENPMEITDEGISSLAGVNIHDFSKTRGQGLYADFKDGKIVEPKNIQFKFDELFRELYFMRIYIQYLINVLAGVNPLDFNYSMKNLINKLDNKMPLTFTEDKADNKTVVCSACHFENPENAKYCMECGAKL
jgi:hypothetical protein